MNAFQGGPCVASYPGNDAEALVYARGRDQKIHQALPARDEGSGWVELPGVNGSLLAADTDLDCGTSVVFPTASDAVTYISGLGSMPHGRLRVASGNGTTFTDFEPLPFSIGATFETTPSVVAVSTDGSYDLVVANPASSGEPTGLIHIQVGEVPTTSLWPDASTAPELPSLVSGVDVSVYLGTSGTSYQVVGLNEFGAVQRMGYTVGLASHWAEPQYFSALAGHALEFSPSTCNASGAAPAQHDNIVITAGGRLWYAVDRHDQSSAGFGSWVQLSDTEVASAPDCYFYDGIVSDGIYGLLHIVALTPEGRVLYIQGSDGEVFTETDLGTY